MYRIFIVGFLFGGSHRRPVYLFDRGHRHLAFISPFQGDQEWSHQRLEGLTRVFDEVADSSIRVVSLPYSSLLDLMEPENASSGFLRAMTSSANWRNDLSPQLVWAIPSCDKGEIPSRLVWGGLYEKLTPEFHDLLSDAGEAGLDSLSVTSTFFACIFLSLSIHIGHFLMFLMRWPPASGLWPLRRSRFRCR